MEATFKFDIDQKVKTVFGDTGIIQMACLDDERQIKYFVQRSQESQWMKERQLSDDLTDLSAKTHIGPPNGTH